MRTIAMLLLSALALGSSSPVQIRGIDGRELSPFRPTGPANILFFISSDCPISNSYAPEIQRLCQHYGSQGVGCSLFYEDIGLSAKDVRKHLDEYKYRGVPAAIDDDRKIA